MPRIFTENQATLVYVAKALKTDFASLKDAGDILVKATPDKQAIYFQHKGVADISRSDLIEVKNIISANATAAKSMEKKLKNATVTLDASVNGGKPIAGQDYVLRLVFSGYIGISPEDSQYWKYGVVHATNGMSASDFYKKMALSIAKNMSREAVQFIKVFLGDTEVTPSIAKNMSREAVQFTKVFLGDTEVTPRTKEDKLTGTYTGVTIKEVAPDWIRGTKQEKIVRLTAEPTTVNDGTGDVVWGTVKYSDGDTLKNGKEIADMEYFFAGEKGDQYRLINWPDYVPTEYLVDPAQEYDVIDIHYSYIGSNESVQKSEKDIKLIVPAGKANDFSKAINALITASGIQINTLTAAASGGTGTNP